MINVRIIELMPLYCKRCNSGKPHYAMVGEVPKVSCRRCRKQACPSCYGEEERLQAVNKWKYICEDCDEIVSKETGEEALEAKYLDKAFMKKIAKKTESANKTSEVEPVKESTEEDGDGKKPEEVEPASQDDMFAPTQPEQKKQEPMQKEQESLVKKSKAPACTRGPSCEYLAQGTCRYSHARVGVVGEMVTLDETTEEIDADEEDNLEDNLNFAKSMKVVQGRDEKKDAKKERQTEKKTDKKNVVCPHMRKGRCFHGMSGRGKYMDKESCPFLHPQVCQRLLDHGNRGHLGCKEKSSGCKGFHPKMCQASLSGRGCQVKDCKLGYHVKVKKTPNGEKKKEDLKKILPDPALPAAANPRALKRVLGQEVEGQASHQQRQLPMTGNQDQTAAFLGQLLMQQQQILQILMSKAVTPTTNEPRLVSPTPGLTLEQLLQALATK